MTTYFDDYVEGLEAALRWYLTLSFSPNDGDLGGCFSWPEVAQAALDQTPLAEAIKIAEDKYD